MRLIRNAILLGFSVGAVSIAACSSTPSVSTGSPGVAGGLPASAPGQTGTIGLELQLSPGITLSTVNYLIMNPSLSGFTTISGTIDVSGSQTIGVTLTLPAASGYSLTLSATDTNSDACAAGPAFFSVTAGSSTSVGLTLVCSETIDSGVNEPDVGIGTVVFTADASLQTTIVRGTCAAATSLVAAPNETDVGHPITLTATGIDPNDQSSDVTLTWAGTGSAGSLVNSSGASNTFNCTSPGTEMVTVTASITGGASCPSIGSLTVTLTCDAFGDAGAGSPDTGVDSGSPDTSTSDGGSEAAAGPLAPCTTAGQTNCVQCAGNNKTTGALANGLCTATQASFVQRDIDKGVATAAGNDPSGSCYDCLFQNTCLDDTHFGDTGRDCGDSTITTGTAAQCLAVVSCVLGSSCSASTTVACYCGTAPENTTCQGNPASAVNGVCDAQIAAGLGFSTQDGTDVTAHFTDGDKAAGVADQIFNCAVNSGCSACLN